MQQAVYKALSRSKGVNEIYSRTPVSGGRINDAFCYKTDKGEFFVKENASLSVDQFAAEAEGMHAIAATQTLRIPRVYCWDSVPGGGAFLVMEYLALIPFNTQSQSRLGEELALLHQHSCERGFGFYSDNTLGFTKQENPWTENYLDFFKKYRLEVQERYISEKYDDRALLEVLNTLKEGLYRYFEGVEVSPSLLHGNLWARKVALLEDGTPVIFDPVAYYGHHEVELSLTRIFSGFNESFYDAYHAVIPRAPGFEERQDLYQLYHYLNLYIIFGESYRGKILTLCHKLKMFIS